MADEEHHEFGRVRVNIAKRMFYGGFLGLPWLWIANWLYFLGKVHTGHPSDKEVAFYTRASLIGGMIGFAAIFTWLGLFVSNWREWGVNAENLLVVIPKG